MWRRALFLYWYPYLLLLMFLRFCLGTMWLSSVQPLHQVYLVIDPIMVFFIHSCFTDIDIKIMPDEARVKQFSLTSMWKSPNGTTKWFIFSITKNRGVFFYIDFVNHRDTLPSIFILSIEIFLAFSYVR
jgi:hypothetical protein